MGLRLRGFFHTSRAKRIFSLAESMVGPHPLDPTWPKCSAQLGWRREFHFLAIQLGTFWHVFVASPPTHPTSCVVSNVNFLVGSVATQPTFSPDVVAFPPPHPIEFAVSM